MCQAERSNIAVNICQHGSFSMCQSSISNIFHRSQKSFDDSKLDISDTQNFSSIRNSKSSIPNIFRRFQIFFVDSKVEIVDLRIRFTEIYKHGGPGTRCEADGSGEGSQVGTTLKTGGSPTARTPPTPL